MPPIKKKGGRDRVLHQFYSEKYKKIVITLMPGEYFGTQNGEVLYTGVGSCIASCIYDKERGLAGMNHFLLLQ
jgi:chemotaxis protein CheD